MDNLRPPKPDRAVRDALQRLEKPFHLLMEVAKQVRTAEEDERRRKRDVQRKEREVARKSAELLARKSSKELKSTDELKSSDALANRKSTDELKSGETLDNRKSTDELKSGDVLARETQRQTPAEGKNGDPNGAAGATAAPDVKKLNDSENTVTSSTATQSVSTTLEATEAQSTVTTSAKPAVETPIVKADANGEPIVERTATDAVVSASSPPSPTKVDTTSTATAATTTKDTLDPKKARTLVRSLLFRIPVLREVLSTRARSEYFLVEFSEYLACFNAAWTKQTRPVPTKECPYVNVDSREMFCWWTTGRGEISHADCNHLPT